jgi:hypothetical protein
MAVYTTTIKTLIEHNFDFKMTSYPIFDENYRSVLNNKILMHFYENEIGFETPALFRHYLNTTLNEIMPFYNTLYTKQKLLLDKLEDNVNIKEDFKGTSTSKTNSSSNSQSTGANSSKNLFQDTPQGELDTTTLENQTYATNVTFNNNNSSNSINDSSNTSGNGTNDYIKIVTGNNGARYNFEIINEIKNNLLNIDMMIINDLQTCFMQIY